MLFKATPSPLSSGQKSVGTVPFGENMMTTRWRVCGKGAPVRLGRPARKGSVAAETPRRRRKSRRLRGVIEESGAEDYPLELALARPEVASPPAARERPRW